LLAGIIFASFSTSSCESKENRSIPLVAAIFKNLRDLTGLLDMILEGSTPGRGYRVLPQRLFQTLKLATEKSEYFNIRIRLNRIKYLRVFNIAADPKYFFPDLLPVYEEKRRLDILLIKIP
jgi:hypothetical protein